MRAAVRALVQDSCRRGGLPVDDVIALVVPLLREVAALHDRGLVAPLRGLAALEVTDHRLVLDDDHAPGAPRLRPRAVADIERELGSAALDVTPGRRPAS